MPTDLDITLSFEDIYRYKVFSQDRSMIFRQMSAASHCHYVHSYNADIVIGCLGLPYSDYDNMEGLIRTYAKKFVNSLESAPRLIVASDDKELLHHLETNEIISHDYSILGPKFSSELFASYLSSDLLNELPANLMKIQNMYVAVVENPSNWAAYMYGNYHSGKNFTSALGNSAILYTSRGIVSLGAIEVYVSFHSPKLDSCNWVVNFGHPVLKSFRDMVKENFDHKTLVTDAIPADSLPSHLFDVNPEPIIDDKPIKQGILSSALDDLSEYCDHLLRQCQDNSDDSIPEEIFKTRKILVRFQS